jgi:hypothetical protein
MKDPKSDCSTVRCETLLSPTLVDAISTSRVATILPNCRFMPCLRRFLAVAMDRAAARALFSQRMQVQGQPSERRYAQRLD